MNESTTYTASLRWVSYSPLSDETGIIDVPEGLLVCLVAHVTPADGMAASYYEIDIHEGDMCSLMRGDLPVGDMNDTDEVDIYDEEEATVYTVYTVDFIPLADALRLAEHHAQNGKWSDEE